MKKMILMTMLVCTFLNGCSTYSPLVDTMGRSGTFDESKQSIFQMIKLFVNR